MRCDRESGDRGDLERAGERRRRAGRCRVRFQDARTDEGAQRERKGREPRPALPVGATQQQDRGEHADHCVEAYGPGATRRQREPEHRADAERNQRRLQPELRAKGLAAGGPQKAGRRKRCTGEKSELQEIRYRLRGRQLERPQCRNREARDELGEQRECEPAPGAATYGTKLGQFRRAPGERDGGERGGRARELHDELLIMATDGDAADRREDGKCDAKQHEPGRRMVEPWHQGFAQPATGRLVAIQLHQAVLPFSGPRDVFAGKPEKSARW